MAILVVAVVGGVVGMLSVVGLAIFAEEAVL